MSKVTNVRPVCAERKLSPSPMMNLQEKDNSDAFQKKVQIVTNSVLPSMSNRPPNPVLSPVRFQKRRQQQQHGSSISSSSSSSSSSGSNAKKVTDTDISRPVLSSLGPDAPHIKLCSVKSSPIVSTKHRKKSLPSIEVNSVPTKYQQHPQQNRNQYNAPPTKSSESPPLVKKLPVVVRTQARPTTKVKVVQDLRNSKNAKKRVSSSNVSAHHQKSRPPKLHMERGGSDHVFKVPTPRDPTPRQEGGTFVWNTPRSTTSSVGSSSRKSIRDLSDSTIERMAVEFVNAEAKRREVSRGIKLTDAERAMMKRAFVAGMRNPSALASPSSRNQKTNLGDLQWEFDHSVDNLDAMGMGFSFDEEDSLDNVVVEPIDVTKDSKWPDFEPDDVESEMSLSLMSMSLEDSATPRDLIQEHLNTPSMGSLMNAPQIHRSLSPTAHQLAMVSERYRQGQISVAQKEAMKAQIIHQQK